MVREYHDGEETYVWNLTHIFAVISISLSFIGEAYIFSHTYMYWRARRNNHGSRALDFSHKLPAALAASDFLFNFHHFIDHVYSLSTGRVPDGALCRWLGFGSLWGLDSTALWSFILAIYMSALVVLGVRLDFDRYWLAVAAFGWGVPFVINLIPLALGKIGNAGMFCMVNDTVAAVILKPGLFLSVFFFIALCYVAIIVKVGSHIYRQNRTLSQSVDAHHLSTGFRSTVQRSKMQRVGLHLIGFTVVYMLQFFPVCIIVFVSLTGREPSLTVNIFDKVLANGNGWMNAIAYRHFIRKAERDQSHVASGKEHDESSFKPLNSGVLSTRQQQSSFAFDEK